MVTNLEPSLADSGYSSVIMRSNVCKDQEKYNFNFSIFFPSKKTLQNGTKEEGGREAHPSYGEVRYLAQSRDRWSSERRVNALFLMVVPLFDLIRFSRFCST